MSSDQVRHSRFLSLVLRHQPDAAGITLDAQGWTDVDALLAGCAAAGHPLGRQTLEALVRDSDKQRFTLSADGRRIRAAQGHSVTVDLAVPRREPPPQLYHGTATRFLESILRQGLLPGARQQVHLSSDAQTAHRVGQRHGKPLVLIVEAARMHAQGHAFHCADNGVWLTDHVPPEFLSSEAHTSNM